jgi:Flp pilus assembly protein TadG
LSKNIITGQMNRADMACGSSRTLFNRRKGQSMVEFALILPVMVLIIAGIFDLGRAFFAAITITNAAREGARYGTLNQDEFQGICNAAFNEAQTSKITLIYSNISVSCGSSNVICQASGTTGVACPDNYPITVKVSYDYNDMILKFFFPNPIHMEKQVEMLVP